LKNAIIGNANSQNILTESIDGNIYIPSAGIFEYVEFKSFRIFSNPLSESSKLVFVTQESVDLKIQIIDLNGCILYDNYLGEYSPGSHIILLNNIYRTIPNKRIVIIKLTGITKEKRIKTASSKAYVA